MKYLALLVAFVLFGCASRSEQMDTHKELGPALKAHIIPRPEHMAELGHNIRLAAKTQIVVQNEAAQSVATYLKQHLEQSLMGADIHISEEASDQSNIRLILLSEPNEQLGEEGYVLSSKNDVVIEANQPAGLFYGVQSLLQLLPAQVYGQEPSNFELILPAVVIQDQPRYEYRGMHLDPCRHFFSVEFTKRYLDYMAYHKLNKFHWHLTEDQGWRIEIKKYPKLMEIGSKRSGTLIRNHEVAWKEQRYDTIPVEGYYTHEDIKEVVAYAAERFIEVIPEIEMPGHSTAALASYPELSCTGGPFEVLQRPGVIEDVYCAGNDSVFSFLKEVIEEVVTLFPSQYIHIGGDECPKTRWEACSKCQARMKEEGLKNEKQLQSWFITEMEAYINSKGKTLIGWSEIMEGGIAPNAVLESWKGVDAGIQAAKKGHKAIMSPYQYIYFDGIYVDRAHALMEPFGQTYCWTNTEKAYSFDPTPDTIPSEYHPYFIGAEGAMWTEFIKTEEHLEYMLLPRLCALSEVCWTARTLKDFDYFANRMPKHFERLDAMEANYRIPHPALPDTVRVAQGTGLSIETLGSFPVRYTTDGSQPVITSPLLDSSVSFTTPGILKTRTFNAAGRGSSTNTSVLELTD